MVVLYLYILLTNIWKSIPNDVFAIFVFVCLVYSDSIVASACRCGGEFVREAVKKIRIINIRSKLKLASDFLIPEEAWRFH